MIFSQQKINISGNVNVLTISRNSWARNTLTSSQGSWGWQTLIHLHIGISSGKSAKWSSHGMTSWQICLFLHGLTVLTRTCQFGTKSICAQKGLLPFQIPSIRHSMNCGESRVMSWRERSSKGAWGKGVWMARRKLTDFFCEYWQSNSQQADMLSFIQDFGLEGNRWIKNKGIFARVMIKKWQY